MNTDPFDLEAQEAEQIEEAERHKVAKFLEDDAFKWLMSGPKGRRFVWGAMERSGLFNQSFDGTSEGTIFSDGLKNEGRYLMGRIFELCPEKFAVMIQEKQEDDARYDAIHGNSSDTE